MYTCAKPEQKKTALTRAKADGDELVGKIFQIIHGSSKRQKRLRTEAGDAEWKGNIEPKTPVELPL